MKKLLVLVAVLAVATIANAGLVLNFDEGTGVLSLVSDDAVYASHANYMVIAGGASVDAGTMIYAGNLSSITDVTADYLEYAQAIDPTASQMFDLAFMSSTGLLATGTVASFNAIPTGFAYLLDYDTLEIVGQAAITPEPMTIALLGLGGLFLRRRK